MRDRGLDDPVAYSFRYAVLATETISIATAMVSAVTALWPF